MDFSSLQLPFRKRIRNMSRFAQIVNVFAKHGYWSVLERLDIKGILNAEDLRKASSAAEENPENSSPEPTSLVGMPVRFRKSLEELGPAFVKLGQILAVREDILSPEFATELRKLHSNVQSLPFDIIQQRLNEELGAEKLANFASIDPKPLAAGSMAQVHSAILKSGEEVVVKVQRPGIAAQIETDVTLMLTFAELIERYIPESRTFRPTVLVQSLADAMLSELDFVREASNMNKMAANFSEVSYVSVPKVYWNLSTGRVLTQEKMHGLSSDAKDEMIAAGVDMKALVSRGVQAFLKMVLIDGFFHGDLHPGNILVSPRTEIALLDFGMVVRLSRKTRENLAGMLVALAREDYEQLVHHYLEITEVGGGTDIHKFQHDIANTVAPFIGLSLQQSRSGKMLWDLARVAARHQAPFPQDLIVFVKTMATLEGFGVRLDPDFDLMAVCQDFAKDILKSLYSADYIQEQALSVARDLSGLMRHAPLMTRRLLNAALDGQLRLNVQSEDTLRMAKALERGSSRLAVAIVIAALLISSSIMVFASGNNQQPIIGTAGFIMAGVLGLYIVGSVLRSGKF